MDCMTLCSIIYHAENSIEKLLLYLPHNIIQTPSFQVLAWSLDNHPTDVHHVSSHFRVTSSMS